MKTTVWDFILSFIAMSFLWGLSALITHALFTSLFLPWTGAFAALISLGVLASLYGFFSAILIRILLRMRPLSIGTFDHDSLDFTYWKLLTMLHYFGLRMLFLFDVAPAQPLLGKLFGAKIGKNIAMASLLDSPYFIEIGDECVLGVYSVLAANIHLANKTTVGLIKVGSRTTIGAYVMIGPNVEIGNNVTVMAHSLVVSGTKIPDGETWKGNPARKWQ